jgi:hypothetical protein
MVERRRSGEDSSDQARLKSSMMKSSRFEALTRMSLLVYVH